MYNYIKGTLEKVEEKYIVVETGGIGYQIFFPKSNIANLPNVGEPMQIFTYLNVKEDEMSLYGFMTEEDKNIFMQLLSVSGVGPKGALNIVSMFGFSDIIKIISMEDAKLLATVPGLGQKTASKICIELGDKVRKMKFTGNVDLIKKNNDDNKKISSVKDEVVMALAKLGIKEKNAREMVNKVEITNDISSNELLNLVLKQKK